jgi:hypothetical protein
MNEVLVLWLAFGLMMFLFILIPTGESFGKLSEREQLLAAVAIVVLGPLMAVCWTIGKLVVFLCRVVVPRRRDGLG